MPLRVTIPEGEPYDEATGRFIKINETTIHLEHSLKAISKWETGAALPNAVQFLNLCDILGVEDVMSCFSDGHTGFLSGLNADGRKMALELIQVFGESEKYSQAS